MEHFGMVALEDESGLLSRLSPSPHSEAVAHELQELSLQPNQWLPSLTERKNVLQLRLQQRRTREQLVDQGIMPPLKSPAAFHEQIKSLERARTENFLKHKIRSRPDRSELVRMHILEETFAEPSLQATQMKLKRARLADDLNEKIAQRPGPMELVEKNILPVDSSVKEAIIAVGQEDYPQTLDDFSFDEDSSDALSPDQPASQESQGSAASPGEPKAREATSPITSVSLANQYPTSVSSVPEFLKPSFTDQHTPCSTTTAPLSTNTTCASKHSSGPTLIKQPHFRNPNDKPRSKKCKEPKPRVKKLKYHQYIPPDQKGEKNEPEMDSNYARLLQQQQLFLQLQILSQQQQHYNYQAILPAPLKPVSDKQCNTRNVQLNTLSNSTSLGGSSKSRQNNNVSNRKLGPLPPSLDDLKVAELKIELKLRGLPVSGTKMDLIERLKPYQDLNNNSVNTSHTVNISSSNDISNPGEVAAIFPVAAISKPDISSIPTFAVETKSVGMEKNSIPMECLSSPLPVSPSPSEQSSLGTDDTNVGDTLAEIMTIMSSAQLPSSSPIGLIANEDGPGGGSVASVEPDPAEKDRKLQEKEKQIEELKRKLEQEQKLVEVLKMQLQVEKQGHQQQQQPQAHATVILNQKCPSHAVKKEGTLANCSDARQSLSEINHFTGQAASLEDQNLVAKKAIVVKQEAAPLAKAEPQQIVSQFCISSQRKPPTAVVAQPQALLTAQGTAQLLLPVSFQGPNSSSSVQLPMDNIPVQVIPTSSNAVFPCQNHSVATLQQSLFNRVSNTAVHSGDQVPLVQNGPSAPQKPSSPSQPQHYVLPQSLFSSSATLSKDPPRYEEAIKQTRSFQVSQHEISSAHSQQMDDLFDILIKSGEILMPTKEESALISRMTPVTANISTMPVNSAVSRPPPRVQVAPPLSFGPASDASVSLENQLEALLDGTLPSGNGMPQLASSGKDGDAFSLIEDLQDDLLAHSGLLDHSQSPMETSDLPFNPSNPCLSLDLPDTNLDSMEWLDLTMPNASSGLTPLDATPPSMFSTDFLDPQELQLHWD